MPYEPPSPKREFSKRLGVYLLGVALGIFFLGFYHQARNRAIQNRQAQQAETTPADQSGEPAPESKADGDANPNPPADSGD